MLIIENIYFQNNVDTGKKIMKTRCYDTKVGVGVNNNSAKESRNAHSAFSGVRLRFLDFLIGIQGRMVDALAFEGDEGRGLAAISFGEVPSNL